MIRVVALGALMLLGCSDDETTESPHDAGTVPPGCGAGSVVADGGVCVLAGVPPERCGAGFEPDGDRGCRALLPETPCQEGQMAVPGDAACAEPTPCADGTWGDAPVDGATVYVDATYSAADADGSEARPFSTIAPAIDAAPPGSVIAIAAGSYTGDIAIGGKALRLWGRCARLVEIVGSGEVNPAAIFVQNGASGTELHGLAVRGPQIGIGMSGSKDVVVEGVWVHDTNDAGIVVRSVLGAASATVRRSLVDRAGGGAGVVASGSSVLLDHVEIRATKPIASGQSGVGAIGQDDAMGKGRASLTIVGSYVHDVLAQGISGNGADVAIDATLVRDVQPQQSDMGFGRGINLEPAVGTLEPSTATITSSAIESCHDLGIYVAGSNATVEATVVRDVLPSPAFATGRGLHAQDLEEDTSRRSTLVVRDTLVERTVEFGVIVTNSDATLERVAIRDTAAQNGLFGDGLTIVTYQSTANVTLTDSWIAHQPRAGLSVFAADVTLTRSRFECNAISLDGEVSNVPYHLEDGGGNECGCTETGKAEACKVLTSNLAPPQKL